MVEGHAVNGHWVRGDGQGTLNDTERRPISEQLSMSSPSLFVSVTSSRKCRRPQGTLHGAGE